MRRMENFNIGIKPRHIEPYYSVFHSVIYFCILQILIKILIFLGETEAKTMVGKVGEARTEGRFQH